MLQYNTFEPAGPARATADHHAASIGFEDIGRAIKTNGPALAAWVAACLALAAVYIATTPPEFYAAAQIILQPPQVMLVGAPAGESAPPLQSLDSAQIESQVQVVKSEQLLHAIFAELRLDAVAEFAQRPSGVRAWLASRIGQPAPSQTPRDTAAFHAFADRVTVRRVGQSFVLEIGFRSGDPMRAKHLANAITAAYLRDQVRNRALIAQHNNIWMQTRIADVRAQDQTATTAMLAGEAPTTPLPDADARMISAAEEPLAKAFPQTTLILAFAFVFALSTGLGAVSVRQALHRTLHTAREVRRLDLDCLGIIPEAAAAAGVAGVLGAPDTLFSNGVRMLRTAILVNARDRPIRSIGFASWSANEGKSTIASNLAHLFASTHVDCVLVDADLRQATLTAALAPEAASGLADVLRRTDGLCVAGSPFAPRLAFIPALRKGDRALATDFIGSADMRELLDRLRQTHLVIVDLPPLEHCSDAQAAAPLLDGVILVVRAARTSVEHVLEMQERLKYSNAAILGVVLSRA